MHTILGAGGAIAAELARDLARAHQRLRLVARHAKAAPDGAEVIEADVSDGAQTIAAVSGSRIVYLLVGLKYDIAVWRELWPRIMMNTIEACKRANARLVFFDNVYAYGKVSGPMTEQTPFNPSSKKGEVRARIATMLLNEIVAGNLRALIARSADFYGPVVRTSILNILVFDRLAAGKAASWLVNADVAHSFTYTPDAARSLPMLAARESAWNQTWHVPTRAPPRTGREYTEMVAKALGVPAKCRVLSRPMIKVAGLFSADIRESYEMLYQSDSQYLFDSTKFRTAFNVEPTTYAEGIAHTAATYKL